MPDERPVLREIAWHELFPWLILTRSFRIATQSRLLLLASVGVMATVFGWWVLARLFSGSPVVAELADAYQSCPWSELETISGFRTPPGEEAARLVGGTPPPPRMGQLPSDPFFGVWQRLSAPAWQLFDLRLGYTGLAFLLLCLIWAAAVWAYFGGAITRVAVMQLGREESIPTRAALQFAGGKWLSYFWAPLFPLVGVILLSLPIALLGLLMRTDIGLLLAAVLWPIVLVAGVLMAILLLGAAFGWPLMWATISSEGTDSFDALSKAYSYVYQRPFHYLFYALVATTLGMLGLAIAFFFAEAVWRLPLWAAHWGGGVSRIALVESGSESLGRLGRWSVNLFYVWRGLVSLAVLGFVYSYFWTASSAIYLLLRHNVDGTEMDEIFVEDAGDPYGLPTLETDAAGVPVVSDTEVVPPTDEATSA